MKKRRQAAAKPPPASRAERKRRRRVARLTDPAQEYVEIWAAYQQSARTYRLFAFLGLLSALFFAWGWHRAATRYPEPMVIRVDEVGRAVPVRIAQMGFSYSAVDPVTRYFLGAFVEDNLERSAASVAARWQRSLRFLHEDLLARERAEQLEDVSAWASGQRRGEIELEGLDLLVQESPSPPYKARVTCERVYRVDGAAQQRDSLLIELEFVFVGASGVARSAVLANPVGLVITRYDLRLDLGF